MGVTPEDSMAMAMRSPRVMFERGKLATKCDMRFDHMSNLVVPVLGV